MNQNDFDAIVKEYIEHSAALLTSKGKEYADDFDRLKNFRTVGFFTGQTRKQVCYTYLMKHVQAIGQIVQKPVDSDGWTWTRKDGTEGEKQRLADAVNYLLLLAACIEEEQIQGVAGFD